MKKALCLAFALACAATPAAAKVWTVKHETCSRAGGTLRGTLMFSASGTLTPAQVAAVAAELKARDSEIQNYIDLYVQQLDSDKSFMAMTTHLAFNKSNHRFENLLNAELRPRLGRKFTLKIMGMGYQTKPGLSCRSI